MKLTLRPRANDKWHDAIVLLNAIDSIAGQMSMIKAALWITLAARIQAESEAAFDEKTGKVLPIDLQLSDHEADLLWRNIIKLRPDQFGRDAAGKAVSPHFGTLSVMLEDFAAQLGKKLQREDESE